MKTTNQPSLPLVGGGGTSQRFQTTEMFKARRLKISTKLAKRLGAQFPARNKFTNNGV